MSVLQLKSVSCEICHICQFSHKMRREKKKKLSAICAFSFFLPFPLSFQRLICTQSMSERSILAAFFWQLSTEYNIHASVPHMAMDIFNSNSEDEADPKVRAAVSFWIAQKIIDTKVFSVEDCCHLFHTTEHELLQAEHKLFPVLLLSNLESSYARMTRRLTSIEDYETRCKCIRRFHASLAGEFWSFCSPCLWIRITH